MGKIHRWGMILAFLVIVVCAWIGVRIVFMDNADATVPGVTGMQLVDAVDALQKAGLLAKVDKIDSPLKADTVVSQNLQPGEKVSSGKVVILRVSKGGSIMPMPDVRGLKFEDGIRRLNDAGFKVNKVLRVTDKKAPVNTIIAQTPSAPQQVSANCMVGLLVSSGTNGSSAFISVPDLHGQDAGAAAKLLEQLGLTVGASSDIASTAAPDGTVVSTKPRVGARVPAGTPISMTFARKPADGEAVVDAPPASDNGGEGTDAVRKVVVSDAEPSQIPSKIPAQQTPAPAPAPKSRDIKSRDVKAAPAKPAEKPAPAKPEQPKKTEHPTAPQKTAKVRYQVPPLTKPLSLE